MPESAGNSLWCLHKHYDLFRIHAAEVLTKLVRECEEGNCNISMATRIEMDEGIANLMAAEEHITDVLSQMPELAPKLGPMLDKTREIRQRITMTNLPMRAETPVYGDLSTVVGGSLSDATRLLEDVDQYAVLMKQEQAEALHCPRCNEDFMVGSDLGPIVHQPKDAVVVDIVGEQVLIPKQNKSATTDVREVAVGDERYAVASSARPVSPAPLLPPPLRPPPLMIPPPPHLVIKRLQGKSNL